MRMSIFLFLIFSVMFRVNAQTEIKDSLYINRDIGFSIEKPSSWKFAQRLGSAETKLKTGQYSKSSDMDIIISFYKKDKSVTQARALISPVDNIRDPSATLQFHAEESKLNEFHFTLLSPVESVSMGHGAAHMIYSTVAREHGQDLNMKYSVYAIRVKEKMLVLQLYSNAGDYNQFSVAFDQIAASFKLLEDPISTPAKTSSGVKTSN